MPGAIIRGELQAIRIGRYCVIGEGTVIRPAYRQAGVSSSPLPVSGWPQYIRVRISIIIRFPIPAKGQGHFEFETAAVVETPEVEVVLLQLHDDNSNQCAHV